MIKKSDATAVPCVLAANNEDLCGLPPNMISVNEMDLFRDEGLKYYRNLLAAGVKASSRTVNGTCHGADVIFPNAAPDIFAATLWDIYGFTLLLCFEETTNN